MNLIVCIDDRGGMLFNRRRQSSDRYVTERIVNLAKESRLLVNSYTAKLFPAEAVVCTERLWEDAGEQDYCFVEDKDVSSVVDQAERLVVFLWTLWKSAVCCIVKSFPAIPMSISPWRCMHSEKTSK